MISASAEHTISFSIGPLTDSQELYVLFAPYLPEPTPTPGRQEKERKGEGTKEGIFLYVPAILSRRVPFRRKGARIPVGGKGRLEALRESNPSCRRKIEQIRKLLLAGDGMQRFPGDVS